MPRPPPILEIAWLEREFQQLHREHTLILKRIDELKPADLVIPELEEQVIRSQKLSKKIDEKVPDKTVPPRP